MDIQKRMEELVSAFEQIRQNTEEVFNGVKPDDFGKLMNVLAENGKLDEKKIVEALMEHKKNDAESESEQDDVQEIATETNEQ